MKLVFTKLETPKTSILVDLGTGEFQALPLESLQDSESGKYFQIPDTIPTNSIRVKTNSEEFDSFDMLKEYQITDDEGNILGGNGNSNSELEIVEVDFYMSLISGSYALYNTNTSANYVASGFISDNTNYLFYKVDDTYHCLLDLVPQETAEKAEGSLLYIKAPAYTGYGYTPVPYRIHLVV